MTSPAGETGERPTVMTSTAPWPATLADVVAHARYKQGFRFALKQHADDGGASFLALSILAMTDDSIVEGQRRGTQHLFIVPPATYNRENWIRWVYERIVDVERHEAAEFFALRDDRLLDNETARCAECEHTMTQHDGRDSSCAGCNSAYAVDDRKPHRFEPTPEDIEYRRVFPPLHGNGNDPYFQWHVTTPEEVRKSPGED